MLPTAELLDYVLDSDIYHYCDNMAEIPDQYDFKWIVNDSNLTNLKLKIDIPHEAIRDEVLAYADKHGWMKHRGKHHPGWYGLTIHGQGHHITNTPDNYPELEFNGYHWTEMADECPITKKWLEESPFIGFERVRFMLLKPGGYILPHTDWDQSRLGPINIAITNPPECKFYMEEDGPIPWQPGDVRIINVGKLHAVWNRSNEDRIHMIIHSGRKPEFSRIIEESFEDLRTELGV